MGNHFGYRLHLALLGGYFVTACSSTAPSGPCDLEVIVTVVDESGAPAAGANTSVSYMLAGQRVATNTVRTDAGGMARDTWPADSGAIDSVRASVVSRECSRYQGGPVTGAPVLPSTETLDFAFSVVRAPVARVEKGTSCAESRADNGHFWLYLHMDSVINQGPIERIYGIWRVAYTMTRVDDEGTFFGTLALGDLALYLDGVPNYLCEPIRARLVARGITDDVIGLATFESLGPCIPVPSTTFTLVETSVPWFP